MKLEQQIVSLELAKKLKELGVKQDSLFYWYRVASSKNLELVGNEDYKISVGNRATVCLAEVNWGMLHESISAYTVAELGEMLPTSIDVKEKGGGEIFKLAIWRHLNKWSVFYGGQDYCLCSFEDETEADARAKMLIYLLENNLIQL